MSGIDFDDGRAAERTELAWSRSALSLLACGAATAKGIPTVTDGHPITGIALLVLGGVVWLSGVPLARQRAAATQRGARPGARMADLVPVALGTAVVGVAAIVIAAFFPG
ncbi:MAG: DUF202 domain-containing protein [Kofleriaceae bacterium]